MSEPSGASPGEGGGAGTRILVKSLRSEFLDCSSSAIEEVRELLRVDPRLETWSLERTGSLTAPTTGPGSQVSIEARSALQTLANYYFAYLSSFPDPNETEPLAFLVEYLVGREDARGVVRLWDVTYLQESGSSRVLAAAAWRRLDARCAHSAFAWNEHMWVTPSHRGQGLGGRVLRECERAMRREGIDWVFIEVDNPFLLSNDPRGFCESAASVPDRRAFWTSELGQAMDPFERIGFWARHGFRILTEDRDGALHPVPYAQISLDLDSLQLPLESVAIFAKCLDDSEEGRRHDAVDIQDWRAVYEEAQRTIHDAPHEHPPFLRTMAALERIAAPLPLQDADCGHGRRILERARLRDRSQEALSDIGRLRPIVDASRQGSSAASESAKHLAIAIACFARAEEIADLTVPTEACARRRGTHCQIEESLSLDRGWLQHTLDGARPSGTDGESTGAGREGPTVQPPDAVFLTPADSRSSTHIATPEQAVRILRLHDWWKRDEDEAECFLASYLERMQERFPDPTELPDQRIFFRVLRRDREYQFFVLLLGDRIAGGMHGWLAELDPDPIWMGTFLWIERDLAQRGLGTAVLEACEAWAQESGATFAIGEVSDSSLMPEDRLLLDSTSGISTRDREEWWQARGHAKLDFAYVQPALERGASAPMDLSLRVRCLREPNPRTVPRTWVLELVRQFHFRILRAQGLAVSIDEVEGTPSFRIVAARLARGTGEIALVGETGGRQRPDSAAH